MWVDKSNEFYNISTKSWLDKNDVEMYSRHGEGKSVVAGRFIKTWKNKILKEEPVESSEQASLSFDQFIHQFYCWKICEKYARQLHSTRMYKS